MCVQTRPFGNINIFKIRCLSSIKCPLKLVLKVNEIVTDFIRGKKYKELIWSADFLPYSP